MSEPQKRPAGKIAGASMLGLAAAGLLLGGCGKTNAVPMDDEYAGASAESSAPARGGSGASDRSAARGSDKKDTGTYADGSYVIQSQYGPVGEDRIDVTLTLKSGRISDVSVAGSAGTPISKRHQTAFIRAIPGVVEGKRLKGLRVSKVAGASWTSDAFDKALEAAREQASTR